MGNAILEADDLHYAYADGTLALQGLSLSFKRGQKIGIVGPNGAGKTTLFLHLNGVLKPNSGRILFNGQEVTYRRKEIKALRSGVGLVFQDANTQLFSASVYQELSFGPMNLGLSDEEVVDRVERTIQQLNISDLKNRPTHFLSGGEKKKVAIASVLTMQPEVIVFDEPLSNLDPKSSAELMALIKSLNDTGKTIVISTHDVNVVYEWADYIYILYQGRILAEGNPQKVFTDDNLLKTAHLEKPWVLEAYDRITGNGTLFSGEYEIPKNKHRFYDLLTSLSCKEMKTGEVYMCGKCGLELEVTKECDRNHPDHPDHPNSLFTCCGEEMVKKY
jgi:cobalt/nickel transport system ATP-binding protein